MRLPGRSTSIVALDNELEVHSDVSTALCNKIMSIAHVHCLCPYWSQASRFRTPDVMIPQPPFDAMTSKHVLRLPCFRKVTTLLVEATLRPQNNPISRIHGVATSSSFLTSFRTP